MKVPPIKLKVTLAPAPHAEATEAARTYLDILDPEQAMTPKEVDAFEVGVQAGITAALEVSARLVSKAPTS